MAKLSVYNTIDRSQLGGKFVPLIQSGVSNYKILASDLGKEYHPGDAIEITDTGEINVNYDQNTLELSGSELCVKTDYDRGVFIGSDGIYIASADDSIGISSAGIKVNPESFVGSGLSYHKHRLSVNAKTPLRADDNGLSLLIGGAGLEIVSGCLYLDSSVVSHTAADAVYYYMSTRTGSSLSIDQDYLVVDTKYIASAGLTTGFGNYNPISVDVKYVANAIGNTYIGSGLYWDNNNYTLSANVNTATGIIVQDNRLYLNAGAGLHTTNNTVKVKASDNTINVSHSGIKVNKSALSIPTASSLAGMGLQSYGSTLYVQSAGRFIGVNSEGVGLHYHNLLSSLTNYDSSNIKSAGSYLYTAIGDGLRRGAGNSIYAASADHSIDVSLLGISVNAGYGLETTSNGLYVKSADHTIDVSSSGISVNTSALSIPTASSLAGPGLENKLNTLYVKSADGSIFVDSSGIGVDLRKAAYIGAGLTNSIGKLAVKAADSTIDVSENGISVYYGSGLRRDTDNGGQLSVYLGSGLYFNELGAICTNGVEIPIGPGLAKDGEIIYIRSSDNSIGVSHSGIKVNLESLAGEGLETDGNSIYIKSADDTINVSSSGISVNKSSLSIPASSLAGQGLQVGPGDSLYVKSADGSIGVSADGIKVNTVSGLLTYSNGLSVDYADICKELSGGSGNIRHASGDYFYASATVLAGEGLTASSSYDAVLNVYRGSGIDLTDYGAITVDIPYIASNVVSQIYGHGLEVVDSSLYVKPADNTIYVESGGIRVNVDIIPTASSLARDGLEARSNSLYVKSADNTIGVTDAGVKVNTGSVAAAIFGQGLEYSSGKLNVYYGSGLAIDAESGKLYATSPTPDIGQGLYLISKGAAPAELSVYAGSGLGFDSYGRLSCLVSHGVDGKNWYRKYQDGWIEQGGYANRGTITLVTPFSNTNYTCIAVCTDQTGAMGTDSDTGAYVKNKTTTSFYATIGFQYNGTSYISWFACGR